MRKALHSLVMGLALTFLPALSHAAETARPAAAPLKMGEAVKPDPGFAVSSEAANLDLRDIPIFQNAMRNGAELYYIGQTYDLHGFLMYKDGRVQVAYLLPNRKAVIFGGLYLIDGTNMTPQQINKATETNAQLKGLMIAATEQMKELERSGILSSDENQAIKAKQDVLPGSGADLSPGERLLNDFITAAGVVVGQEGKPLIVMLVDPQCPHCKATWGELRDSVAKGRLRVKLVPIGAEGSENERQAAKFLRSKNPLETWNKFVGGDQSVLAGAAGAPDLAAIRANMIMALGWKIQATPYIVYRGSDGKVKVVQGKPDKIASILSDLKD